MSRDTAAEIERLALHRNARFRAWRELGVPVSAEWRFILPGGSWRFSFKCERCGLAGSRNAIGLRRDHPERPLREAERAALTPRCCEHLAPLLGREPAEIDTLVSLELLENPALAPPPRRPLFSQRPAPRLRLPRFGTPE